jgi:prepilin-type N-terminal cleavage/methylation domain-containing protein
MAPAMLDAQYGSVISSRDVCKKASLPKSATGINAPTGRSRQGVRGFTLVEVVIAVLISTIVFATVVYAYVGANDRSEWSAYSFAAQSLAHQAIEQTRTAKWDPQNYPAYDDLGLTNYTQVEILDVPLSGPPVLATNYVSISTVTNSPEIRQLRADCVWVLVTRYHGAAGPFTNTAVSFRASDQ